VCEEDIVGLVFGFEAVATDSAVGAAEVVRFPREVEGAECGGNELLELWAGGGVNPTSRIRGAKNYFCDVSR
jgi:hypothetical protein